MITAVANPEPSGVPTLSLESVAILGNLMTNINLPVGHDDFETAALAWVRVKRELAAISDYYAATDATTSEPTPQS